MAAGLALLVVAGSAWAQEEPEESEPPEAQEEKAPAYPRLEVERPLTLPRGLSEVQVGLSYFDASRYFNADGESTAFEDSEEWRLLEVLIELDYGLAPWLKVGAGIPYFSGKEFEAEGENLGDLYGLARLRLVGNAAKTAELDFDFQASFPTGDADLEMELKNKHFYQENLRTGDPNVDLFFGLSGRYSWNKMAFRGGFLYGYRFAGEIKSGIEALEDTVEFDPGESLELNLEYLYQIQSWLAGSVGLDYQEQAANELDGESLEDDWSLWRIRPGVELQITPNMDLIVETAFPLSGQNAPVAYPIIVLWKNRF